MREVSRGLSTACSDGPLQLAWRTAKSSDEQHQLTRLRLSLGAMLLFAALRAPLPAWQKLGLQHFATMSTETAQCARDVPVPDGVLLMGCTPIFHTLPSVDSAKIPPRSAATFHVAVPHVLLESQHLCAVLQERPARKAKKWSNGSLLMLMVSSALVEAHTRREEWATNLGCWKQDREAFFPLVCAFRLVFGLELLNLWNANRRPPKPPTTEQVFRFLQDVPAGIRGKPMRFDTGTEHAAQPLIPAPLVALSARPATHFDPQFQRWAPDALLDGAAVALQDFAAWVGHLSPGRVVYSSHRSRAGDFYFRLEDAVMVVQFKMWGDKDIETVSPETIWDMYNSSVGEPGWWNVSLVSHIIIGNAVPKVMERQMGHSSCLLIPAEKQVVRGLPELKAGSELIVCRSPVLGAFLGTHQKLVARHQELFGPEPAEPVAPPAASGSWKDRPVGPGVAAARSWRTRRPVLPSSKQYELNFEALATLLNHVSARHDALVEAVELMLEADEQQKHRRTLSRGLGASQRPSSGRAGGGQLGAGSRDASPAPGSGLAPSEGLAPSAPGSRSASKLAPSAPGSRSASKSSIPAQAATLTPLRAIDKLRGTVYALIFTNIRNKLNHDEDEHGPHSLVRIERAPSPEPTAKSRRWRPPTPHPSQDTEKKGRQEARARKNLRRNMFDALAGGFDFLSLGDAWKMPVSPPEKAEKTEQKHPRLSSKAGGVKATPRRRDSRGEAKKAAAPDEG